MQRRKKDFYRWLATLIGGFVLVFLASCQNHNGVALEGKELFTIDLGTLPGELDWFYRDGYKIAGLADIQSRGNRIYISGGLTGKVMVFNMDGDLLTMVYDPSHSTAPVSIEGKDRGSVSVARSFVSPGSIAATANGFLLEDGVGQGRHTENFDGVRYDRVVLRFDLDGTYLGHLGREGFGGSPFPFIDQLDVRSDGGIVVTCRFPDSWIMYWFDSNGRLITTVMIPNDQLPDLDNDYQAVVYSMRPDPVEWTIHIRMDMYPMGTDGSDPEPRLYTFDLNTREYLDPIVIGYPYRVDKDVLNIPPDYLGTTVNGVHVFLRPEGPDIYRFLLVDKNGGSCATGV